MIKKQKQLLKPFLFWFTTILYLEFFFALSTFDIYQRESIINIFLNSILVSSLLNIITNTLNQKITKLLTSIILFILGFLFSLQLVFYKVFKTFFSFETIGLSDQLKSFLKEVFQAISQNFIYIFFLFLPFILYLIFKNKISLPESKVSNYMFNTILFVITVPLFILNINNNKTTYDLIYNINDNTLNISKLGVINSYFINLHRIIFDFSEKIEITEEEPIEPHDIIDYGFNKLEIDFTLGNNEAINNYMQNSTASSKNKYTGLFKNYNLIYITAESFSEIAVSEELTPTLYKLINSGFKFNNYYTPNYLSTIGGEFQALTGLYPDKSILTTWRSGKNYFPFGLGTVFNSLNYKTYAYHNNWYQFQDRDKYLKSLGLNNYLGCKNGLEKRINCDIWPQSDTELIQETISDYINNPNPFMAYYMSVSGHMSYTFTGNQMARKHQDKVKKLDLSESAKAYLATQIELDLALETLIYELEKANKLDNTVIVLVADHYPYSLSLKDINSLSSYERDSEVEVNHNSLIIWNKNVLPLEIDKVCMSSDVIPTIYNLFGIEYDSRLFIGNDIFSTKDGLAILANRSFITDKGTYFANTNKFVGENVSNDYIENIKKIVNNRLLVSKLIIKENYYKSIIKENE